jgi:hypothetical protein
MARKVITMTKLARLEARMRVVQGANRAVFMICCVAAGLLVVATAFPEKRELDRLKTKLEAAKAREAHALADREYHAIEHRALREDPAFLEIHARDRLDYYREGERVLKFHSER